MTRYFVEKGVKGVYVNGSSGECIYQSVEDRKIVLEHVMKAAQGKLTVIAHVACNNTKDSMEFVEKDDFLPMDGDKNSSVILRDGDFLICYPSDGHRTAVEVNGSKQIKKAIFKVRI